MAGISTQPSKGAARGLYSPRIREGSFSEVAWYQKSLNLLRKVRPLQGEKLHPGFTLQSAQKVVLYAEGWALWLLPLGRKEGVIPGAHVAHPYQFYRAARGGE